jgi:hypothetical protein
VLGPDYPDVLATRLELGTVLAMLGDRESARALVEPLRAVLREQFGHRTDLQLRAEALNMLLRLPSAAWRAFRRIDDMTRGSDE